MSQNSRSKLLVVGGTGFIGSHLVTVARDAGFDVSVLSLNPVNKNGEADGIKFHNCDICNFDALAKTLEGNSFEYVVNLSGYIDHASYFHGGDRVIDEHLAGVENLIKCLDKQSLRTFVQIGSSDEYGDLESPQSEEMLVRPISPYSYAKSSATTLLQMLNRTEQFPVIILRLFLTYGPGQDEKRFLPQIIRGCLNNESFPTSKGLQLRDFCYVEDIVNGILKTFDRSEAYGEVINLASGDPTQIKTMVETVVELIGSGSPDFGAHPYRPGENMKLYADVRKAKDILHWSPSTSIKEGLQKTIEYYKAQM